MVEAIRLFDTYHFRISQADAASAQKELALSKPPRKAGEKPYWSEYYSEAKKSATGNFFHDA